MGKLIIPTLIIAYLLTSCIPPKSTLTENVDSDVLPNITSQLLETSDETTTPTTKFSQQPSLTNTNPQHESESEIIPNPLLEFDSALQYIEYLESVSCDDPCFWGLEPGISSAEDVRNTFQPFEYFSEAEIQMSASDEIWSFKVTIPNETFYYSLNIMLESDIVTKIQIGISNRMDPTEDHRSRPGEENKNSDVYLQKVKTYEPAKLFNNWGVPDGIFIRTFIPAPAPQNWSTHTFVYYASEGSIITYINPTYYIDQENSNYVCIIDNPELSIWLFDPNKDYPAENILGFNNNQFIYLFEDVTELNTEEFMELYNEAQDCQNKFIILPRNDDYNWAPYYIQP